MGKLVAFKPSAAAKRPLPEKTESAEILFFTGVRYVTPREHEGVLRQARRQMRRDTAKPAEKDCPRPSEGRK